MTAGFLLDEHLCLLPDPLLSGALDLAFSSDGAWLIARDRFSNQLRGLHLASGRISGLPDLAGRRDDLTDGNFILRQPGFASDGRRLWTLLGGEVGAHPFDA